MLINCRQRNLVAGLAVYRSGMRLKNTLCPSPSPSPSFQANSLSAQKSAYSQRGVGLIEVLVAVFIMSIGFLAAGNLQISSMRANQDSMQSAQALRLAGDMMDSMRNNPLGVSGGFYDGKSTGSGTEPACASSTCTPQNLAALDLFTWSANFQDLRSVGSSFVPVLFGVDASNPASGSISEPNADGSYTITVNWQGSNRGQSVAQSIQVAFHP